MKLRHPHIPDHLDKATFKELKRIVVYQVKISRRLSANVDLDPDDCRLADDRVQYIQDMLRAHPLRDDLARTIEETEKNTLRPLLLKLRKTLDTELG